MTEGVDPDRAATTRRLVGHPEPYEEFFWRSGADGRLRLLHCDGCGRFHHPPVPRCPYCYSDAVQPRPLGGGGTLVTFTVNRQPFLPGFTPPYPIGLVEVDEDPSIRLCTNLVGIGIDEIAIGLRVHVVFEPLGEDLWIPQFAPGPAVGPPGGGAAHRRHDTM